MIRRVALDCTTDIDAAGDVADTNLLGAALRTYAQSCRACAQSARSAARRSTDRLREGLPSTSRSAPGGDVPTERSIGPLINLSCLRSTGRPQLGVLA